MTGESYCKSLMWRRQKQNAAGTDYADDILYRYSDDVRKDAVPGALAYLQGAEGCSFLTLEGVRLSGTYLILRPGLRLLRRNWELRTRRLRRCCLNAWQNERRPERRRRGIKQWGED